MHRCLFFCATLGVMAAGYAMEGHGKALWLAESPQVEAGGVVRTVVELTVDPGWHVYWLNPGDAGMPTAVTWQLPAGFECGPLQHPWPISFTTGELKGYGHEGVVRYPVTVTASRDFKGEVTLRGELNWLACNDEACVPGAAKLELKLAAGPSIPGPHAKAVQQADGLTAAAAPEGLKLMVADSGDGWLIRILGEKADVALKARAMVATAELCRPGVPIRFQQKPELGVHAKVAKSEYAPEKPDSMELWLWPDGWARPVALRWKSQAGE